MLGVCHVGFLYWSMIRRPVAGARRCCGRNVLAEVQVGLVGVPHAPAVELVGDPTAVLRPLRGLEMGAFVFLLSR